jgi:hypothetical protein
MQCPSPRCGSSNVHLLSHYVDSLPPGSPLRARYARPPAADGSFLWVFAGIVAAVVMLTSGGITGGLLVLAGSGMWGWVLWSRHDGAEKARTAWANRRICLACTEQWVP